MGSTRGKKRTTWRLAAACALLGLCLASAGSGPAAAGPKAKPAAERAAGSKAPARPARNLSGIWEVHLTGSLLGPSLLCRAVPALDYSQRDTVLAARNLEELLYAVVPDSALTWFDAICEPVFDGDAVSGTCRVPLSYARPCTLVADLTFHGRLTGDRDFAGEGESVVTTGGPGLCPKASCPGQLRIVARRVADVPPAASAGR